MLQIKRMNNLKRQQFLSINKAYFPLKNIQILVVMQNLCKNIGPCVCSSTDLNYVIILTTWSQYRYPKIHKKSVKNIMWFTISTAGEHCRYTERLDQPVKLQPEGAARLYSPVE